MPREPSRLGMNGFIDNDNVFCTYIRGILLAFSLYLQNKFAAGFPRHRHEWTHDVERKPAVTQVYFTLMLHTQTAWVNSSYISSITKVKDKWSITCARRWILHADLRPDWTVSWENGHCACVEDICVCHKGVKGHMIFEHFKVLRWEYKANYQ